MPGPVGMLSTGDLAHALSAHDPGDRAGRHQGRHAVGGRRGVAQIAAHGGAALDLDRADQLDAVHHARPGRREGSMTHDLHARHGGTEAKAAVLGRDRAQLGDLLDVHQELRLDQIGLHLDDDVGAAGEQARRPARARQERHRGLQALRRFVSEFDHHAPRPLPHCRGGGSCPETAARPSLCQKPSSSVERSVVFAAAASAARLRRSASVISRSSACFRPHPGATAFAAPDHVT